jgi:hypothetical protein
VPETQFFPGEILMRKVLFRALAFFCLIAGSAQANLIVNGDFENPGPALTGNYTVISTNTIPAWTSTVGNGVGPANYYSATNSTASWIPNPQNGNYCVQLDSSTDIALYTVGATLSQTVTLTANTPYVLSFFMSAEVDTVDVNNVQVGVTSRIDVILNGGGFANQNMVNSATGTTGFLASYNGNPKASPELSWVEWTLVFTPTVSGDVTITFQDVWVNNSSSSNAALDHISLIVVPEITHWSIFAAFFAAAIITTIRKSRR